MSSFIAFRKPSLPLSPSNFDNTLQLISRRWNLLCRPTFAGLQSPSGFVFYTYKAQPKKIWLSACGWNKTTRVVDFSSVAGFSTSFATLEAFCVDRHSLASNLLLALCFTHIKLSQRRHCCRRVVRTRQPGLWIARQSLVSRQVSQRWELLCQPTFAGLQSPSGFVFYIYKAQPKKIWLSACG
jgi:hypothetical protein